MNDKDRKDKSRNPDPITGAPGSHPVGTGIGAAAGGAAAGAAVGSVAGPVGTVGGAAAGAIVGGLAGKGIAEKVNPTQEDTYWRHNHYREPFGSRPYSDYRNAYRSGYEGYTGGSFEEHEEELRQRYEADSSNAHLPWSEARGAARAAWHRLERNAERIIGYDVQDQAYTSIGKVHSVWADESGQPVFLGVKTGWIFGRNHVVPVYTASVNTIRRVVQLPYTEALVKEAPAFDADADITDGDQEAIYRHYGITGTRSAVTAESTSSQRDDRTSDRKRDDRTEDEKVIALREEKLKVGKREIDAGGVRIRKIVRTETVNQPVELRREEFVMERVPASELGSTAAGESISEDDIFLPLRREEAVVEKDVVTREGVRIGRKVSTEKQNVQDQVRREEIEVARKGEKGESERRR